VSRTDHAHASRAEPGPQEWQARLREQGYRLTPQRELVLHAVERLGHATPDEVHAEIRAQSSAVNLSTVYRTLELLEELGLVRHAHITDRAPTYHSTAAPDHAHLVCRGCGKVTEATPDDVAPLTETLEQKFGFRTDIGHLTVFGHCEACAERAEPRGHAGDDGRAGRRQA